MDYTTLISPEALARVVDDPATVVIDARHDLFDAEAGRRAYAHAHLPGAVFLHQDVDLLIHDAQYTDAEYEAHVGWGHSSLRQALALAEQAGVARLMTFHHDPEHSDAELDRMLKSAQHGQHRGFDVIAGTEGLRMTIKSPAKRSRAAIA